MSQGCSDAGFCTVHYVNADTFPANDKLNNSFKVSMNYGVAKPAVSIFSPYVEYTRRTGSKLSISTRLLFGARYGDLASTNGVADALISSTYSLNQKLQLTAGAKLPFNKADKEINGKDLPMAYQISLGTFDMIFGVGYNHNSFRFAFAYQQPIQQNSNEFKTSDYSPYDLNNNYLSTYKYERSGDVLFRFSYFTSFAKNKYSLTTSILPIYHINNDTFENALNKRTVIDKSKGLTLNLNLFLTYKLNYFSSIEFIVGAPIIAREVRPDGLSQFTTGIEYAIQF